MLPGCQGFQSADTSSVARGTDKTFSRQNRACVSVSNIRTMPYINSDGTLVENRSPFRVSIISDAFWAVVNFIGLFLDTLVNPQKKRARPAYESRPPAGNFRGRGPKGSNIKGLPKASECGPKGG